MFCEPNTWSETEFGGNFEYKYRKDDIIILAHNGKVEFILNFFITYQGSELSSALIKIW